MTSLSLIATTAFGLEAVVKRELLALGYEAKVISPGWLRFEGDELAVCRTNLWLRCADRVLIEMASFEALDFDALFDTTKTIAWDEWLPHDANFPVNGRSIKSQLSSVPAVQRTVKKAIVESLQHAYDTDTLPETGPMHKIEVALLKDQATLTLDTTGPSLHKRGYRLKANQAPLKETLAAAMVSLSFWRRERPLIDPFCGSGTIAIEAALIGRNMAPGLHREFSAELWQRLPAKLWDEARTEAEDLVEPPFEERIIGNDTDHWALVAARENAENAGVADLIHFQQKPFEELSSKRKYGCVITNPPYGLRLGDFAGLEPLYESMPEVLRNLPTWSHFILTAYPNFEKLIHKKAARRRKLYNGRIECTYYQFHGPREEKRDDRLRKTVESNEESVGSSMANDEPSATGSASAESSISSTEGTGRASGTHLELPLAQGESWEKALSPTLSHREREPETTSSKKKTSPASPWPTPKKKPKLPPVFGGLDAKAHEQAQLFHNRLKKRARHLRRWPTRRNITCFRLYERDVPEIPLVVDRYENYLHIAEYERPHDRDIAQHADWLDLMCRTAGETLEVPTKNIYFKSRKRQAGKTQHEVVSHQKHEVVVHEGGLKFLVNLSDYIDTGLFLDHRVTRGMVRDQAAGANFLNLFGYTGSFTVYAADGGAAQTTTVDLSSQYLDWAKRNMTLNGYLGKQHQYVRADVNTFILDHPPGEIYDIAIVDPPTFSNSKRTENVWEVQRSYAELLNDVLELMKPGGVVYFSTNFRRFKFQEDEIRSHDMREITKHTVPEDFRNRRIHRCWKIVRDE